VRIGIIGDAGAGKAATAQALRRLSTHEGVTWHMPPENIHDWLSSGSVDKLLLVVSLVDGPMPITEQHLEAASRHDVPLAGVWLNKLEVFDKGPEWIEIIELETRDLITACGLDDDVPFGQGSSRRALDDIDDCQRDGPWLRRLASFMEGLHSP